MQIGSDVFWVEEMTTKSGILRNDGHSIFSCESKADSQYARFWPALCSFQDRYIFVSGGEFQDSVERYDCASDSWSLMPALNGNRHKHSSCALGNVIYVICGASGYNDELQNTIESLDTRLISSMAASWEIIEIAHSELTPRAAVGVASLGKNKMVIFGGNVKGD